MRSLIQRAVNLLVVVHRGLGEFSIRRICQSNDSVTASVMKPQSFGGDVRHVSPAARGLGRTGSVVGPAPAAQACSGPSVLGRPAR